MQGERREEGEKRGWRRTILPFSALWERRRPCCCYCCCWTCARSLSLLVGGLGWVGGWVKGKPLTVWAIEE